MKLDLEYGKVYDLYYGKKDRKGIYLGKYNCCSKHRGRHLFLINTPDRLSENFSIIRFTDFRMNKDSKLILRKTSNPKIPIFQKHFYKDLLLESKVINE